MNKFLKSIILIFVLLNLLFFNQFFFQGKLPVPSDTIAGLYFPYRDFYAKQYPRGLPFKNFQITDPVRQQYPWKKLSIDLLKQGQIPIWNPYNFSGTPLLANFQSGAFYFLNVLFFIFPYQLAWSILVISQPFLAMVFMYFFLRNLQLSKAPSVLGSLSFAFCGFFVSWMEWGNVVSAGLWLPLILLSIDKIFFYSANLLLKIKRYYVWSFIFFFSLTSSFFAGHLQIFFYLFVISFFYFFARWAQFGKNKKTLVTYLTINTLFLILTAVQWLPTLQFILISARDLDQNWRNPGWFVPWQNLTQFIAPDFFGNPSTLNYWGIWNYGEFIGYIGFIPLVFALYAALFNRRKIVWFFSSVFLLSLIFALPTIFAKVPFKFSFPFLSTSQPTRLVFLADASLSILAAFGFEYFLKNKRRIFFPLTILGFFLLLFWSFIFLNHQLPRSLQVIEDNILVTKSNLIFPSLLFVISIIIFIFYFIFEKRLKYTKKILIIVIVLVTVFDLYRFTSKYITFADKKYLFPETKILTYLQKQKQPFRVMNTDSRVFPPNFSIMYKIQTPDGYDPLFTKRYAELSAAIARGGPNINPPFGFNRIITIQRPYGKIVDLFNIKYVLSLVEIDSDQFKKIMSEGETNLYENIDVLPRAFFVSETINSADKQDAINKLFDNQEHLNRIAILENSHLQQHAIWIVKKNDGKVKITKYEENKIIINTKNANDGFLVITDSYYPTWHAKICSTNEDNCEETKIYLTDYNFRGIVVPAGNHSIVFYDSLL